MLLTGKENQASVWVAGNLRLGPGAYMGVLIPQNFSLHLRLVNIIHMCNIYVINIMYINTI